MQAALKGVTRTSLHAKALVPAEICSAELPHKLMAIVVPCTKLCMCCFDSCAEVALQEQTPKLPPKHVLAKHPAQQMCGACVSSACSTEHNAVGCHWSPLPRSLSIMAWRLTRFFDSQAALQDQIAALLSGFAERKAGEVATAVAAVRQQIGSGQEAHASDLDSLAAAIHSTSSGIQVCASPEYSPYRAS